MFQTGDESTGPELDPTRLIQDKLIHLVEYVKLKDEQLKRIDFRDHLIYHYLVVVGGIAAWGLSHPAHAFVFLLIPWASLIMGWTYLFNDNRVSELGRYIRTELVPILRDARSTAVKLFGWENFHRNDRGRPTRKIWQFFVDQFTFVLTGIVALALFLFLSQPGTEQPAHTAPGHMTLSLGPMRWVVVGIEGILLFVLGLQFWQHAEFGREHDRPATDLRPSAQGASAKPQ
jgi:hypothetical protein